MAIYDIISYNGEKDLFDLRYHILKDYVDQFIVCESPTTFSGRPKPLYYEELRGKYGKVIYYINQEDYTPEEIALAESSPNTNGAEHWKHEFLQKERIKQALVGLKDDDIVFIGDCDEIWNPEMGATSDLAVYPAYKLHLRVYPYYLNNESNEHFHGTLVSTYGYIKDKCLNELRSKKYEWYKGEINHGWHFTSQGGEAEVRRKLNDSYTPESYNTPWVQEHLKENIEQRKDYIGRNFEMKISEEHWPKYLKDNKDKYKHLLYENRTNQSL